MFVARIQRIENVSYFQYENVERNIYLVCSVQRIHRFFESLLKKTFKILKIKLDFALNVI